MKLSLQSLAEALYEESLNAPEKEARDFARKTIRLLAKNKMIGKFERFIKIYKDLVNKKTETIEGQLTSAHPLTEKALTALKKEIKESYKSKHVVLEEKEDKSLVGGYKLKIGDYLYDQSVRGRLKQLQKQLTS